MTTLRTWLSVADLARVLEADPVRAAACLALWLAPRERAKLAGFAVPKRRREWLAGRIAAKELIRRRHQLTGEHALRSIEIVSAPEGPSKGKPAYWLGTTPGPFDLSISHSGDCAIAALAEAERELIGIDIEQIEARDASFEVLALSDHERAAIAKLAGEARAVAVTQRWVLKEALSKALGHGLRMPLPRVTAHVDEPRFEFVANAEVPAGTITARLDRIGGLCVAWVSIR